MARKPVVKFTANFERHLEDIERFPGMGRPCMLRQPRSVKNSNALATLRAKLLALTTDPEALREYLLKDCLLRYALPCELPDRPVLERLHARGTFLLVQEQAIRWFVARGTTQGIFTAGGAERRRRRHCLRDEGCMDPGPCCTFPGLSRPEARPRTPRKARGTDNICQAGDGNGRHRPLPRA
ncbi:MAG: hypothetical protein KDI64_12735 [Candidatus Accumulibacter sp.]|nr:hypothetical protein [Accumulibacter sp.]